MFWSHIIVFWDEQAETLDAIVSFLVLDTNGHMNYLYKKRYSSEFILESYFPYSDSYYVIFKKRKFQKDIIKVVPMFVIKLSQVSGLELDKLLITFQNCPFMLFWKNNHTWVWNVMRANNGQHWVRFCFKSNKYISISQTGRAQIQQVLDNSNTNHLLLWTGTTSASSTCD